MSEFGSNNLNENDSGNSCYIPMHPALGRINHILKQRDALCSLCHEMLYGSCEIGKPSPPPLGDHPRFVEWTLRFQKEQG